MKDFIDDEKYKEYYEIVAWIRGVKKELGYSIVFEEDLNIEGFLNLVNHKMDILDEKDRNIVIPHLRDLKLKMLNI